MTVVKKISDTRWVIELEEDPETHDLMLTLPPDALAQVAHENTMLLVEQNLALVKRIAEHVIVMDQGKVVYQGGPEVLEDEAWVHQMLGVGGK